MHIRGAYQVMPKGQKLPLPGPVRVRIGKPMAPGSDEGSRQFTARVEKAVRALALEPAQPDIQGTWIERWQLMRPRELRYEESVELAPPVLAAAPQPAPVSAPATRLQPEKPGGPARSAAKTPRASRPKRP
jgi:hypothetical protein